MSLSYEIPYKKAIRAATPTAADPANLIPIFRPAASPTKGVTDDVPFVDELLLLPEG